MACKTNAGVRSTSRRKPRNDGDVATIAVTPSARPQIIRGMVTAGRWARAPEAANPAEAIAHASTVAFAIRLGPRRSAGSGVVRAAEARSMEVFMAARPDEQAAFQAFRAPNGATGANGANGPDEGVHFSDGPAQSADGAPDAGPALLRAQVGAVGASFLRVRPWVVAGPTLAVGIGLAMTGASALRLALIGSVQGTLLAFFIAEAVGLWRAGSNAFVSPRRLGWSLAITLVGLGAVSALTGAARSPLLPMLLAPTGIAYAAFGARPGGTRFLGGLLAVVAGLAALSPIDPWPPLPPDLARVIGLTATVLAGVLLWFGVAALTAAHAAAAVDLDRLRQVALHESALRMRDLEAVGAKVAHELKNPLAAVQALTQLSARTRSTEAERSRDAVVLKELDRMAATLDAYLSFARPLDDLRWRPVRPASLVRDVAAAIEGRATSAGIRIEVSTDEGETLADRDRLQDALLNLVSNAVDATPEGGTVRLVLDIDGRRVRFVVNDTGRGMDAKTVERIGTPYFTTRDGGTGLGVVLARTVARQHGGDLAYESHPGRGTTAVLTVPRRSVAAQGKEVAQ